jgi:hypothetical protein
MTICNLVSIKNSMLACFAADELASQNTGRIRNLTSKGIDQFLWLPSCSMQIWQVIEAQANLCMHNL